MILRSAKLSEHIKRDGQTPPAAVTSTPAATSAPGSSSRRRSCRLMELEVSSEKSLNSSKHRQKSAPSTSSTSKNRRHVHSEQKPIESTELQAPDPRVNKTHESIHLVQPNRVASDDVREDSDHVLNFVHTNRDESSIPQDFQRDPNKTLLHLHHPSTTVDLRNYDNRRMTARRPSKLSPAPTTTPAPLLANASSTNWHLSLDRPNRDCLQTQ